MGGPAIPVGQFAFYWKIVHNYLNESGVYDALFPILIIQGLGILSKS